MKRVMVIIVAMLLVAGIAYAKDYEVTKKAGEYNVLNITQKGRDMLKGKEIPRLLKPAQRPAEVPKVAAKSWSGVDKGLFETLRKLRTAIAGKSKVPAYIVFGDMALRDMAKRKPSTMNEFLEIKGVGQKKCNQYGKIFLDAIKDYSNPNPRR